MDMWHKGGMRKQRQPKKHNPNQTAEQAQETPCDGQTAAAVATLAVATAVAVTPADPLFDQREAAAYCHVGCPRTFAEWRRLRKGPRYVKLGSLVRYRRSDLDAWIAANVVNTRPNGNAS